MGSDSKCGEQLGPPGRGSLYFGSKQFVNLQRNHCGVVALIY
jgi:hypothetical protein